MRDLMLRGQPLASDLWAVFKKITISAPGLIYWIIDGVDESKESGEEVLRQVLDLLNAHKDARAVLLGRTHVLKPIQQENYAIEITPDLINADIDAYIIAEIDKSATLKTPEIRDLAFRTLRNGSQGMFLWVKLMIHDLQDLDNISLRFTKRLLAFVIAARRPLKIEELQYAYALVSKSDSKASYEYSLEAYLIDDMVGKVFDTCGSCIQITEGVVVLVHISAKEFLTRPESEWLCDSDRKIIDLRIDPEESHSLYVSACIDYLEFGNYGFPLQVQDELQTLYTIHPFLEYASKNLLYHVNRSRESSTSTVEKFEPFPDSKQFLSWAEYFLMHFVEDGSSGFEVEEFDMWLKKSNRGRIIDRIPFHLREQLEILNRSSDGNDQRIGCYKMMLDMLSNIRGSKSPESVSNDDASMSNLVLHKGPNYIDQTIPMVMETFRKSSALTAPMQLNLLVRLQHHIQQAKALTDPLELLFRLILKNAEHVPVYALLIIGLFYETVEQHHKALQVFYSALTKFGDRQVRLKYEIWNRIGDIYYAMDQFQEAEEPYTRAVEGREKIHGQNHAVTLTSLYSLGLVLFDQSKYIRAQEIFQQVTARRQRKLGSRNESTLHSTHMLGLTFHYQNKYAEAEKTFQQAVRELEETLGLENRYTLCSIYMLGRTFYSQDKYAEAEEVLRQVVKGQKETLGLEDEDTLWSMYILGCVLNSREYYRDGEDILERVVNGQLKSFGLEHSFTRISMIELGHVLYNQGEYWKAAVMYQKVLQEQEKVFGSKGSNTLLTTENLGNAFIGLEWYEHAKEMYQRTAEGREETLGPDHKDTLSSREMLVEVSRCLEEFAQEGEQMRALFGQDDLGAVDIQTFDS
ncbi:TPR-like protein [Daldinia bambusicola]|nr:TPR-like protein [Daldinia bambusicola]